MVGRRRLFVTLCRFNIFMLSQAIKGLGVIELFQISCVDFINFLDWIRRYLCDYINSKTETLVTLPILLREYYMTSYCSWATMRKCVLYLIRCIYPSPALLVNPTLTLFTQCLIRFVKFRNTYL